MKKVYTLVLVFLIAEILQAQQTRKVLFIGNSYTFTNNLPDIISNIASSMGDSLIYDIAAPGGYTFTQHLNDSATLLKIMQGGWDYIVMQEQSQLPSFDSYSTSAASALCNFINLYSPCARKLFYMTWGRKHGDALNCPVNPPSCTYEGMDSMIKMNYLYMASITNAEVSPVGAVWRNIITNNPSIELYNPDESHPSEAGSYAGACSFYSLLYRRDPALSSYNYTLSANDAAIIRNAAKAVAFDSLSYWDFGYYTPFADFNYVIGHGVNEVIFFNLSHDYDNFIWDFGDGDTSTVRHPVHSYVSDGVYHVTLTAKNCDLSQVNQSVHSVDVSFCNYNPTVMPDTLLICPNTVDSLWTQSYDTYQWLDSNGDTIPGEINPFIIPSANGYYSVLVSQNGCYELSPIAEVEIFSLGPVIFRVDTMIATFLPDTSCFGDTIGLHLASNKPYGDDFKLQWYKDSIPVPGDTTEIFLIGSTGNYQIKIFHVACGNYIYYESPVQSFIFKNCNIGIDEFEKIPVQVYPNPAQGSINIKSEFNNEREFIISDMTGRFISNGIVRNNSVISLNNFSKGIYYLKIEGLKPVKFIVID